MAILIPIFESNYDSLVRAINKVAAIDWNRSGNIHVLRVGNKDVEKNGQIVADYCQSNRIENILVPARVQINEKGLAKAGYKVHLGPSIANLIHGDGLATWLRVFKLDWRSKVVECFRHYSIANVTEVAIDQWLLQFERLGNHRAVGEHLVKLLDILPATDLGDAISADAEFFGTDLVVGFNKDTWGKSWATVSNLIRKRCPSALLLPITDAMLAGRHPKVLRLVEDGLFSGTEIRAIFDSLRGIRPSGRTQKVAKLNDTSILSLISAQLFFGAVCDFGEATVRRYMSINKLPNIQIPIGTAARKFSVLRGTNDALADDCSDDVFKKHLIARSVPFVFQEDKGWPSSAALLRGKEFCQQVGKQLWTSYIKAKPGFQSERWPEERLSLCSLGMDGLGLSFAFPHSVPKATLPLYWAHGQVKIQGTTIDWVPLLPNAVS